jgi:Tol biopolymer transport system component
MMIKRLFSIRFTRLDVTVWSICLGLLAATFLTILVGDRVGITILGYSPSGITSSTSSVIIRFSQIMNRSSIIQHFQTQPEITGTFSWNGTGMTFTPTETWQTGQQYTITLKAGAESESGRQVLSDLQFSFNVRYARIAYLSPADNSAPSNIWIANLVDPSDVRQITFSSTGITSFDVSPTGSQIVFAERNGSTGLSDIKMLDLETDALVQLTNCVDNRCEHPRWSPSGTTIAYERIDFNSDSGNIGLPLANTGLASSPSRIWLIHLTTEPPTNDLLFNDNQKLGYLPVWSADGNQIAVYDRSIPGVRIYDFVQNQEISLPSLYGVPGFLSPDGAQLILPEVARDDMGMNPHLQIITLSTQEITPLSTAADLVSEQVAAWRPDGQTLVIARRNLNDQHRGDQLYLLDAATLQTQPLVMDADYVNEFFYWDPEGVRIIIQRVSRDEFETLAPEVWIYDTGTNELSLVATNAYNPRWIP